MIPLNDVSRQISTVRHELDAAIARVVSSGRFLLAEETRHFEAEFAAYCGTAECICVASGTDAIEIALRARGVTNGMHVATVANAGFYTTTALMAIGAVPAFVDVDADTGLMNLDDLQRLIDARCVDAIVVTHLYGLLHDMARVTEIAARARIPVLEDCAQAHGATRDGRRAGSFGDAAAFSFYPTKNLGGLGDGGAVVTSDAGVAARARKLRQYGWSEKYHSDLCGSRNSRLDELQAAALRVKLTHLDDWNDRRRQIAHAYSEDITNACLQTPPIRGDEYVAHLYVVGCDDRDGLRAHLRRSGIMSDVHYPVPDHMQKSYVSIANGAVHRLPVTEHLAARLLTLPCFPEMTDPEIASVVHAANAWRPAATSAKAANMKP